MRMESAFDRKMILALLAEFGTRRGSGRVVEVNVLPVGWQKRRIHIGDFGGLKVWSVGRVDLLAMKVYAGRTQDRADVIDMGPTAEELGVVRKYLDQLRIPSRGANLDQVQSGLRFVDALAEGLE